MHQKSLIYKGFGREVKKKTHAVFFVWELPDKNIFLYGGGRDFNVFCKLYKFLQLNYKSSMVRIYKNGAWQLEKQILKYVDATYVFNVPDDAIDFYLDHVPVVGAGAIAIEGFGNQFLEKLNGSYSAVVGLPMYELRSALIELGFTY